jgi:hypothetical protein
MKRADVKKLQREWYDKLAAAGFTDLEYGRSDGRMLARSSGQDLKSLTGAVGNGSKDLAAATGELRNHATFSSLLQRVVCGLLDEGLPKSGIKAGLAACRRGTGGALHWAIETTYGAARALVADGRLYDGKEEHDAGAETP